MKTTEGAQEQGVGEILDLPETAEPAMWISDEIALALWRELCLKSDADRQSRLSAKERILYDTLTDRFAIKASVLSVQMEETEE